MRTESTLNMFFQATAEATEEAILNSFFKAETMEGRDRHVMEEVPIERVIRILKRYGRI